MASHAALVALVARSMLPPSFTNSVVVMQRPTKLKLRIWHHMDGTILLQNQHRSLQQQNPSGRAFHDAGGKLQSRVGGWQGHSTTRHGMNRFCTTYWQSKIFYYCGAHGSLLCALGASVRAVQCWTSQQVYLWITVPVTGPCTGVHRGLYLPRVWVVIGYSCRFPAAEKSHEQIE